MEKMITLVVFDTKPTEQATVGGIRHTLMDAKYGYSTMLSRFDEKEGVIPAPFHSLFHPTKTPKEAIADVQKAAKEIGHRVEKCIAVSFAEGDSEGLVSLAR